MSIELPQLRLADWQSSRDTIHAYARVIGDLREQLMPKQKHWWHITLHAGASGLTTTPMPFNDMTVELLLDYTNHKLVISTNRGHREEIAVTGRSLEDFQIELAETLTNINPGTKIEVSVPYAVNTAYERQAIENYWRALSWVDQVFKKFKGELREETSPVQVFPHHFDLAMSWFSGRTVPGVDPNNEESADEHLTFGFLSGDEAIPDAYFYVTAYPLPDGLTTAILPGEAYWHTEGFTGAILMYDSLRSAPDPEAMLMDYLLTVQKSAASFMR
jgi:hypothetical protein